MGLMLLIGALARFRTELRAWALTLEARMDRERHRALTAPIEIPDGALRDDEDAGGISAGARQAPHAASPGA